jgi:hypothetical protein
MNIADLITGINDKLLNAAYEAYVGQVVSALVSRLRGRYFSFGTKYAKSKDPSKACQSKARRQ